MKIYLCEFKTSPVYKVSFRPVRATLFQMTDGWTDGWTDRIKEKVRNILPGTGGTCL